MFEMVKVGAATWVRPREVVSVRPSNGGKHPNNFVELRLAHGHVLEVHVGPEAAVTSADKVAYVVAALAQAVSQ